MGHSALPPAHRFSVEKASHSVVDFVEGKALRKPRAHERKTVLALWAAFILIFFSTLCYPCALLLAPRGCFRGAPPLPDLYEASILELQDGLSKGYFTSVDLVQAYFARIEEVNRQGANLRAVIEASPSALKQAAALDKERRKKGARGPLHGIPILLKDNIATEISDGMNTTAGSYALLGSVPPRDATVAANLREAGVIFIGKAGMSEWAHNRAFIIPSGWSGRGGQATSPYYPLGDAGGSSTGSGTGTAIGLAAAALGTETDGSITGPSSRSNIVGIKPTVGLTSRAGVIPIMRHQDTVGPMARSVADAAVLLTTIAGRDILDNFTLAQPSTFPNYLDALQPFGLAGAQLGVVRNLMPERMDYVHKALNHSIDVMRGLGAEIVEADFANEIDIKEKSTWGQHLVAAIDFKEEIEAYISKLLDVPTGVKNISDIIRFNIDHADLELIPPYCATQDGHIDLLASYISTHAKLSRLERPDDHGCPYLHPRRRSTTSTIVLDYLYATSGSPAIVHVIVHSILYRGADCTPSYPSNHLPYSTVPHSSRPPPTIAHHIVHIPHHALTSHLASSERANVSYCLFQVLTTSLCTSFLFRSTNSNCFLFLFSSSLCVYCTPRL